MERDRKDVRQTDRIRIAPFTLVSDVLKEWWVILLGALAAAMLAYVIASVRYVPQYSSSATFVVIARGNSNALNNLNSANEMAKTFEKILKSNMMKKIINEKLETTVSDGQIAAHVIEGTNLLVLSVTDGSPKEAIDLIRTVMDNYADISFYSVGDAVMDVLEEPRIPFSPMNPLNAGSSVKKGFLVGAVLLTGLFAVLSYLKDTVKVEDEIEEKLDARDLGMIVHTRKYKTLREAMQREKKALLITNPLADFAFVEGYKKLAMKVDYQMRKEKGKVLVVTSVSENEGKSTAAANVAIALAQQSKRVLLIEGDLRRPSQFLLFGQEPQPENEIGEFLKGNAKLKDILLKSGTPDLYLAIGRNCYNSSTEILNSENMAMLLAFGKKAMDYIIIDTPPAGLMGDAEVAADYADSVMVVVKQNAMLAEDINDVLDAFREHHSSVLGVVLNGVKTFSDTPIGSYYGRYGRYGKYGKYGKYGNYNKDKGIE